MLKRICKGILDVQKVHAIPSGLLPVRYVVILKNMKEGRSLERI